MDIGRRIAAGRATLRRLQKACSDIGPNLLTRPLSAAILTILPLPAQAEASKANQQAESLAKALDGMRPVMDSWLECNWANLKRFIILNEPIESIVDAALTNCRDHEEKLHDMTYQAYLPDLGHEIAMRESAEVSQSEHQSMRSTLVVEGLKLREKLLRLRAKRATPTD